MNLLKYLLPCALVACSFATTMHADDFSTTNEERDTDIQALSQFVKSKSGISIQEKGGNLMLSGDVRAEWDYTQSKIHGKNIRGKDGFRWVKRPGAANAEFTNEDKRFAITPPAAKHAEGKGRHDHGGNPRSCRPDDVGQARQRERAGARQLPKE